MDTTRLANDRMYSVTAPGSWFNNLFRDNGIMILLLAVVAVVIIVILWPNIKTSVSNKPKAVTTVNGGVTGTVTQPTGGLFSSSSK